MHNVGTIDRVVRIVIGAGLLALVPRTAWGFVGLVPLLTAAVGYCPLYSLIGVRTTRSAQAG